MDPAMTARIMGTLRVTLEQASGIDDLEPERQRALGLVRRAEAGDAGAVTPGLRAAAAVLGTLAELAERATVP